MSTSGTRSKAPRKQFLTTFPGLRSVVNYERDKREKDEEEFLAWDQAIGGSFPEFLVYRELLKNKLDPNRDFQFQAAQLGGRLRIGGAVVDFILFGVLAGRVQGEFFHFRTPGQRSAGVLQRRILEGEGFVVIDMLEDEILQQVNHVVKLFIQGSETPEAHSKGTTA